MCKYSTYIELHHHSTIPAINFFRLNHQYSFDIIVIKPVIIKSIITHHFGLYDICFMISFIRFDKSGIFYEALQAVMAFAEAITKLILNNYVI